MRLSDYYKLEIAQEKILDYLLNITHPDGRTKALFFIRFGFSLEAWRLLSECLKEMFYSYDVKYTQVTQFGIKYILEGIINTPDKRNPLIGSIWFVEKNDIIAKLVTAYPL